MTTESTHPQTTRTRSGSSDTTAEPGTVRLSGVSKAFGDTVAVKDLDLDVAAGEFVSMLGPSGSGKTTVLRMIAGFEEVDAGRIELGGVDVTRVSPHRRAVNTVFQDYALFPHMTIAENVAYGLRIRGESKSTRVERVRNSLQKVRLERVADRKPSQLSGGQRQRIALARALIMEPQVLLLDEPLGALDKQLREEMQIELKQIQRDIGITFIFVTHDQEEALTLSDRVAVFNNGKIEQVGTAREVYEYPQTEFVARFLGLSNLIDTPGGMLSVRPERVRIQDAEYAPNAQESGVDGVVAEIVYTGPSNRYIIDTDAGTRLIAAVPNSHSATEGGRFDRGDRVTAVWTNDHASTVPGTASAVDAEPAPSAS